MDIFRTFSGTTEWAAITWIGLLRHKISTETVSIYEDLYRRYDKAESWLRASNRLSLATLPLVLC